MKSWVSRWLVLLILATSFVAVEPAQTAQAATAQNPEYGLSEGDIVIDNDDATQVSRIGAWSTTTAEGVYGANALFVPPSASKDRAVQYKPVSLTAGHYDVYVSYTSASNRAGNVPVEIYHDGENSVVYVDQKVNGYQWFKVGTFYFSSDGTDYVRIKNEGTPTSGDGYVIADAVRFSRNTSVVQPSASNPDYTILPGDVVIDNTDSARVTRIGFWSTSTSAGRYGANALYVSPANSKDRSVQYKPAALAAGNYNVYVSYIPSGNRASNVPVEIFHDDEVHQVLVDQKINGYRWFRVGTFYFKGDGTEYVRIKNEGTPTSGDGYVIADAVRFSLNTTVPLPPPKPDVKLSNLTVNAGLLGPIFNPDVESYVVNVPNKVTSLQITAATISSASEVTLKINGTTINSGTPYTAELSTGVNEIPIVITANNQSTEKTYTLRITRAATAASDATLSSLKINHGALDPVFHPNRTDYALNVGHSISSITITPTVNFPGYRLLTVNGTAVTSGAPRTVSLATGLNTIPIVVTAEDYSTRTYNIAVTRAASLSNNADLSGLDISDGYLSFSSSVTHYNVQVDSVVSTLNISPRASSPEYKSITVNGSSVASGGSRSVSLATGQNTISIVVRAENNSTQKTYTLNVTRSTAQGETVGHAGIINPQIAGRISQAVVFFVNHNQGYANNVRKALDLNNDQVKPFLEGSLIYVPLQYTAESFGASTSVGGDGIVTVTLGSNTAVFTSGSSQIIRNGSPVSIPAPVLARQGQLFVSEDTVTQILNKQLFKHNSGLTIFSDIPDLFQLPADQALVQEIIDGFLYEWGNVKIYPGGFVTGMVIHPTEPELMYARTDVGGAYRWNPESQEWVPLMDNFGMNELNLVGIDGIAISRTDSDIVYVAAGMYGNRPNEPHDVLKSTDRGQTWQRTNLNKRFYGNSTGSAGDQRLDGERIAVDPFNGDIVYVGTRYDGLWVTTNGAETWSRVTAIPAGNAPVGVTNVEIDYNAGVTGSGRAKVIYVGVEGQGVYKSTDGGSTWTATVTNLSAGPVFPRRMALSSDGTLYVTSITGINRQNLVINSSTAPTNGVFKYNGSAWTNVTPSASAGQPFGPVAVKPDNPNYVVAVEGYYAIAKVYVSQNGGQTWIYKGDSYGASSQFLFDPHNTETLYDTHGSGIHKTLNFTSSAINWIAAGDGIEELCATKMLSLPSGRLLMGTLDRGGFTSNDINVPAVRLSNPITSENTAFDFCESDSRYVFRLASSQWGETPRAAYSTNGGDSWTEVTYPYGYGGSVAVSAQKQANGLPLVVIWTNGHTPKLSRDFGQTWEDTVFIGVEAPVYTGTIYTSRRYGLDADRTVGDTFYLYDTVTGKFYTSTDGKYWKQETAAELPSVPASEIAGVRAAPYRSGEVWVSSNTQGLFRSSDYGKNFTKIEAVQEARMFSFGKNAPDRSNPSVYVYGRINNMDGVFRSDDMGVTWVRINNDAYQMGNDPKSIVGDRKEYGTVYVGTGGRGIYYGKLIPQTP